MILDSKHIMSRGDSNQLLISPTICVIMEKLLTSRVEKYLIGNTFNLKTHINSWETLELVPSFRDIFLQFERTQKNEKYNKEKKTCLDLMNGNGIRLYRQFLEDEKLNLNDCIAAESFF